MTPSLPTRSRAEGRLPRQGSITYDRDLQAGRVPATDGDLGREFLSVDGHNNLAAGKQSPAKSPYVVPATDGDLGRELHSVVGRQNHVA